VGAQVAAQALISVALRLGKPVGVNSVGVVSGGGHTPGAAGRQTGRQTDSQAVSQRAGLRAWGGAVAAVVPQADHGGGREASLPLRWACHRGVAAFGTLAARRCTWRLDEARRSG
jgi:hypothetical protein